MAVSRRQIFVCDRHDSKGEEVIITGDNLFGFDGEWWRIGFCSVCDGDLAAGLREFVKEHGIKIPASDVAPMANPIKKTTKIVSEQDSLLPAAGERNSREVWVHCMWCDHECTNAALNAHVRRHGFKGFKAAFGPVCPLCNEGGFTLLGRHAFTHGVESTTALFQAAIKLGDPHGVVEARLKAAS